MGTEAEGAKSFDELVRTNPDALPTNPEELAAMIVAGEGMTDPANTDDPAKDDAAKQAEADAKAKADADAKAKADADAKAKEDADAKAKADADAKAQADAKDKDRIDGVLSKDGQRVLPYAALHAARQREDEARRAKEEAEKKAADLQRELEAARANPTGKTEQERDDELAGIEEKIAALTDVPEVGEVVKALHSTLVATRKQLDEMRGAVEQSEQRQMEEARSRVQASIEGNPTLFYWQQERPELFNEAVAYDKQMRASPALAHLSLEERFGRVVSVMETIHGKTELPEAYRPKEKSAPTQQTQAAPAVPPKDEKQDSKAKLQERTLTLSDLPGGVPPASDQKAIEEMSHGDIERRVNAMLDKGMSIQDILATYG
jgi:hypothetical protein